MIYYYIIYSRNLDLVSNLNNLINNVEPIDLNKYISA